MTIVIRVHEFARKEVWKRGGLTIRVLRSLNLGLTSWYQLNFQEGLLEKTSLMRKNLKVGFFRSISSHDKIIPLTAKQSQEIEKFKSYVSKIETQTMSLLEKRSGSVED
jgi:hypothetical protein